MSKYSGKGASTNAVVYVCNLPSGTDENMLAEHFGTIGLLKKDKRSGRPKIWLYHDKVTNEPKGDATVTYEDPHAAAAAVEWFNNKDFHGAVIGVFLAESKNKDDLGNEAGDSVQGSDPNELEEAVKDLNDGGGRGTGKAWQQDGDWLCTNTSCGNVNFAFRGACNRCGTARPAGASSGGATGGGRGRGRDGHELGGQNHAVGGTGGGLFGPNDWSCPMCGNINWAKRLKCNICNTNKPGHNEGGVRGGRGGGYKELDEEEIEETKRRRRETEEDDGEMYDEFGNLKKKFRSKTQQSENALGVPGVGRAGWEVEELGAAERDRKERSRERGRDEERVRHRSRERDRLRERDRGREYGRERERDRDRSSRYFQIAERGIYILNWKITPMVETWNEFSAYIAAKYSLLRIGSGFMDFSPGFHPAGHTSSGFSCTYCKACTRNMQTQFRSTKHMGRSWLLHLLLYRLNT